MTEISGELKDVAALLRNKESVERRLISSLCYDFGSQLAQKFNLEGISRGAPAVVHLAKLHLRKLAYKSFWEHLSNLPPYSNVTIRMCTRELRLKVAICQMISKAITKYLT